MTTQTIAARSVEEGAAIDVRENGGIVPMAHETNRPANGGGRDMWLRVADITIDLAYQKALSEPQLSRMGRFDPDLAGAIEISHRPDGHYVALDGQHRVIRARRDGVEFIRAIVHEGLSPEEEAGRFVLLNTLRSRPKMIDIFNAQLAAADEEACAVRDVIYEAGCKVPRHSGAAPYPGIVAVDACVRVYRVSGHDGLLSTLQVLTESWPEDARALRAYLIHGVAATLYYYSGVAAHPNFAIATLKDRLARVPASKVYQRGLELATGGEGGAGSTRLPFPGHRMAVVETYNRGAQRRLPPVTARVTRAIAAGLNPWKGGSEE